MDVIRPEAANSTWLVTRYLVRLARLRTERSSWRDHWKDLSDNIMPRRQRFDPSDRWRAGSKRNEKIVNNTATRALRILASGMMAGITSPARPWFRLRTRDPKMNETYEVRAWLEQVERRMREVFARSNIYNALPVMYLDLGAYGTAPMYIEEHEEDVLRAHVMPIGSYCLAQNDSYQVNALYRETTLTVEQLVRKFGYDNCSMHIRTLYDRKQYDEWVEVIHVVEPNDDQKPDRIDPAGMPFRSVWFEWAGHSTGDSTTFTGAGPEGFLGVGGFWENPVMSPRWMVTGEDTYGNSPGMDALGDIRGLQHLEKRRALALDKIVNPPMQGPSSMRGKRTTLLSGDVTYVDSQGGRGKFEPAHVIDPKVIYLESELQRIEDRIGATFYADLFLMLAQSGVSNMTAREVEERHEEKMLQLGPVLERLHDELLDPLIDRAFGIMYRRGLIPPPPAQLEGEEIRPEYISILAQAQQLIATVGVERLLAFTAQAAEIRPEVVDKLNMDKIVDEYGEMLGVNPELIVSTDEVERLREKRQAQVTSDQASAIKDTASAAQSLSETDIGGDTAMNKLMQAYGATQNGAEA